MGGVRESYFLGGFDTRNTFNFDDIKTTEARGEMACMIGFCRFFVHDKSCTFQ